MANLYLIAEFLVVTLAAGIFGTGLMTLVMTWITRSGFAHVDMIEAIGSLFTKTTENARLIGGLLHFIAGVVFAMIYTFIINLVGATGLPGSVLVGTLLGAFQGFVMSFLLVIWVAENHPVERYRNAGFRVAVSHFIGHLVFGFTVGLVVSGFGFTIV